MIDRDTIIKLAREAGLFTHREVQPEIVRFAALVAAAEREACAAHYLDVCRKAIVEEREACYQIALTIGDDDAACKHTDEVARRIRARSNT